MIFEKNTASIAAAHKMVENLGRDTEQMCFRIMNVVVARQGKNNKSTHRERRKEKTCTQHNPLETLPESPGGFSWAV